jgi:hypothetical protein
MSITPGSGFGGFGAVDAALFVAIELLLFLIAMEWVPSVNMQLGMPESNSAVRVSSHGPHIERFPPRQGRLTAILGNRLTPGERTVACPEHGDDERT